MEDVYMAHLTPFLSLFLPPEPCYTVKTCLLIRNKEHKLFTSHDYGLLQLVRPDSLSVVIAPKDINVGELSERSTVNFVTSTIELYLHK